MSIRPGRAKGPWVGTTGGGGGTDFTPDQGIDYDSTNELLSLSVIPFWDTFTSEKPFWNETQALYSDDWQIDTVNEWLEGIAENNTYDWIRRGIEGDYDYSLKIDCNTATSAGIRVYNAGETVLQRLVIRYNAGTPQIAAQATGKAEVNVLPGQDTVWLRMTRRKNVIGYYYKLTDTDSWTEITTYTDVDLGHGVSLYLDAAETAEIHEVLFFDNKMPERIMASAPKSVRLGNITGNVATDARRGNVFYGVLTGSITLTNPTNPLPWQKIIYVLEQDGTGSRTISFGADFRFSTDIPSPTLSTGAGDTDYLGFIYNPADAKWDLIALVQDF